MFLNQNQELCAASQFINPLSKDRFLEILDPKCLPAKDLLADEKCMNILKELKVEKEREIISVTFQNIEGTFFIAFELYYVSSHIFLYLYLPFLK